MVNFLYFLQSRAEARYIMACAGINTVLQKSLVSPMLQRPFAGFGPSSAVLSVWARSSSSWTN